MSKKSKSSSTHLSKKDISHILEAQKAKFKYAVFSGGGAKGAIYSGVYEALYNASILQGLEVIAGSSAGAITAALIATGISVEDFKALSEKTNFSTLLGSGFLQKDGKPIYQLLHDTITNNIKQYTKNLDIKSVCSARILEITELRKNILDHKIHEDYSEDERQILTEKLYTDLRHLQEIEDNDGMAIDDLNKRIQSGGVVYFKDLAMLRLLNPSKFKDLIVTATNKKTGELTIFSAETTPNVEIALACRASSAIPRVLSPTKINGVDYVDGGYRDNIPLKYFNKHGIDKSKAEAKDITGSKTSQQNDGRILALAFGGSDIHDSANISVYTSQQRVLSYGVVLGFIIDVVCKVFAGVGGKQRFTQSEIDTYNGLRKNALNTIILDTGEVHTLSFQTAQEQAAYLHIKGRMQTTEYFRNHNIVNIEQDKHFEHKSFMLGVYEQILAKTPKSKRHNEILQTMLEFCESEKWEEGKDTKEVIKEYIQTAATSLQDFRLSINTEEVKILLTALNDTRVTNIVRKDFLDALGLDIGPIAKKHLPQLKFKMRDVEDFLAGHNTTKSSHTSHASHRIESKKDGKVIDDRHYHDQRTTKHDIEEVRKAAKSAGIHHIIDDMHHHKKTTKHDIEEVRKAAKSAGIHVDHTKHKSNTPTHTSTTNKKQSRSVVE